MRGSEAWAPGAGPPVGRVQQQRGGGTGAEGHGFFINVPNLHRWIKVGTPLGPSLFVSLRVKCQISGSLGQLLPGFLGIPDFGSDSSSLLGSTRDLFGKFVRRTF